MAESFINRLKPDPDGLDYEGLREEGIRLVQELSGDIWTDYNLHDPGVTLLEAICYALTDLVYRTSFSAADYLVSSDGTIDFKQQALYRPDEIFPCRPVTENDYRKLILNSVPNTDNVWIKKATSQTGDLQGLYRVYVQLSEQVKNQTNEGVRNAYASAIIKIYLANRNLCEDLAGVEIVERIPYSMRGEIEIEGKKDPADILAEVYFECAQYLSPKISVQSYAEMVKSGSSLDDLLTGNLTDQGYIAEDQLHSWRGHFSIPDLIGKLARVDGVKYVKQLVFVDGEGNELDSINLGDEHSFLSIACLSFPLPEGDAGIKLYKTGKIYPVSLRDVVTEFNRLDYKHQALRRQKQRFAWIDALLPAATFRKSSEYYSLQHHFPDIYGMNAYGVPDSAPPERKAQAKQLKAYLLFFEQVLANFLQNVQEIPKLFSLDEQLKRSYFYQVLGNDTVPKVEEVYLTDIAQMDAELAELLAGVDNYADRRNRVLDYLLGLYGEKFSQNSLHQFFAENVDIEEAQIKNKIAFLKNIVDINKNRAAAFDYRHPSGDHQNISGLKKKLNLLLALQSNDNSPCSTASGEPNSSREEVQIVEHILLRPYSRSPRNELVVPDDFYSFRVSIIFSSCSERFSNKEFRVLAEETVGLNCPAHIYPEIFWLESERMLKFKSLHKAWLQTKQASKAKPKDMDAAAEQVILFLLEMNKGSSE